MTTASGGEGGHHVGDQEAPSEVVLRAVAEETGRSVLDLPPLQDAVDVDALDRLLASDRCERVSFEYQEFTVTATPSNVTLSGLE
jgi:hypothetical protein